MTFFEVNIEDTKRELWPKAYTFTVSKLLRGEGLAKKVQLMLFKSHNFVCKMLLLVHILGIFNNLHNIYNSSYSGGMVSTGGNNSCSRGTGSSVGNVG